MSATQFCVTWVSYTNSISKGFSHFQQNGEFVDMTLAAEGHLVKVHQNIVALASPYLKAMIQSASCQHPVIFLNKISHEVLGFILEYMYTGEVTIPMDVIPAFIEACKALCINGVENFILPKKIAPISESNTATDERPTEPSDNNNIAAHIKINSGNYNVEVIPIENQIIQNDTTLPIVSFESADFDNYLPQTRESVLCNNNRNEENNTIDKMEISFEPLCTPMIEEPVQKSILINSKPNNTTDENLQNVLLNLNMSHQVKETLAETHESIMTTTQVNKISTLLDKDHIAGKAQHYTVSNRGSLQLLLNRYLYHCHHSSCGGRKRRWRCSDYRKLHCPAFIDTEDDIIINRSEVHVHPHHDTKIMKKFKSKSVFTSVQQAESKVNNFKERVNRVKSKKLALKLQMSSRNQF